MRPIRTLRIDLSKIEERHIYRGKNGAQYVELVMMENRTGEDQYGNLGFAKLGQTKAQREAGEQTPIVGNWKEITPKGQQSSEEPRQRAAFRTGSYSTPTGAPRAPQPEQRKPIDPDLDTPDDDDIPF